MSTPHRAHLPLQDRLRPWLAIGSSVAAVAFALGAFGFVVAGIVALLFLFGAVLSADPVAFRAYVRQRAFWQREHLPPLPDTQAIDAPLPTASRDEVFHQGDEMKQPDYSRMDDTGPLVTTRTAVDVLVPAEPATPSGMPAAYAEQLEQDTVRSRWFSIREMHPGDRFVYGATVLTVKHVAFPQELDQLDMALVAVDGLGAISLTLPASQRWLIRQAIRQASVRCLVCGEVVEPTPYDLAQQDPVVTAVCDTCEKNTLGEAA